MGKIGINLATGSLQKDEIIVGIDLGTTNSLIAAIHPDTNQPIALKEFDGSSIVPSVVHFDNFGNSTVGDEALQYLISHPAQTIYSAKRLIGRSFSEVATAANSLPYKLVQDAVNGTAVLAINNKQYSPTEIAGLILSALKKRAEHILKTPVNKAVITVPAYFNDAQRQATRAAGKLAGLDVLRIINEPTAASLAYGLGLRQDENKTIAVYDLGGGTFDISILKINAGIFEVLSTNGDTNLGGDDMDNVIVAHWMATTNVSNDQDSSFKQALRLKAEEAKKWLSGHDEYAGNMDTHTLALSLSQFNDLISVLIDRTIASCVTALKDANLKIEDIDDVVLVGGSTRVPAVKDRVGKFFNATLHHTVNPDEVVALGAAIQADILSGKNKDYLLLDVTPLSLGLETSGGLMDVLVPRNTKIPAKASRQYTTQVDGQSGIKISVYQGERDLVNDNRKLAAFNLSGIPGMPAGLPKVEIAFLINADGILTVSAKELRSGVSQEIEVKAQVELSDEMVEQMLLDAMQNASQDVIARALAEAKAEGEQLLATTERFLQKNAQLLTKEEIMSTAEAMQALQLAITMTDKTLIQEKVENLNNISRPYAERVMDSAIATAIKGTQI